MDGTVICARRAEGLAARAGSAVRAAASGRGGMARVGAAPAWVALAGAVAGTAFGFDGAAFAAGLALGAGTAFFATGLAVLTGIFLAGVLAAGLGAAFLAAVFTVVLGEAFLAGAFLAAAFAAGLAGLAAGLALAALALGFALALDWGFTSLLLSAAALACCPARADLPRSGDESPSFS